MTPDQQRLIDAAAEALYEEHRARIAPSTCPPWAKAGLNDKRLYLDLVTIPVTVALKEAAKMAKTAWLTTPHGSIADADAMNDMCEDLSSAISSLIPAQEKTNASA
jgi:hypothetical protein